MTTIAFLVPTKNRQQSLRTHLPGIIRAARRISAMILVCDQSSLPFPDRLPEVTILHCPGLSGLPAARNALLAATDAEVVCFLDDDCELGADFGVRLLEHVRADHDVVGWGPIVETRPRWLRRAHRLAQLGVFRDPRRLLARRRDRPTTALFGCCFAVRRARAARIGFDARRSGYALGEDLDFFKRLDAPMRFCADLRAVHRRDGGNRADANARLRMTADFLIWLARRHGRCNPFTVAQLMLALAASAVAFRRLGGAATGLYQMTRRLLLYI